MAAPGTSDHTRRSKNVAELEVGGSKAGKNDN